MTPHKHKLRPLCARQELEVLRRTPYLLPYLLNMGLGQEDAMALAGNVCLLSEAMVDGPETPLGMLEAFSLSEIAALCREVEELAHSAGGGGRREGQ